MIKTLTVLVLGAGASKPFGFPTGQELLKLITHQLLLFTPEQTTLGQTLLACGFPAPDILRFASALHLSQRKSVDAFLEFRSEFLDVGKAAMIAALIPYEKPDTLFNTGDWYQHLLKAMEAPFDEMPKNQLGIITYNYDRSLEFYLLTAFKNAFEQSSEACARLLGYVPIIHLHGQLGKLQQTGREPREPASRFYDETVLPELVKACIPQVRIIHETTDDEPQFAKAQSFITKAHRVCFLGFGYDERNIQRLLKSKGCLVEKQVCGTAFQLTNSEKSSIRGLIGSNVQLGNADWGNLALLRETGILL